MVAVARDTMQEFVYVRSRIRGDSRGSVILRFKRLLLYTEEHWQPLTPLAVTATACSAENGYPYCFDAMHACLAGRVPIDS